MPIQVSSLSHSFEISSVEKTIDTDCFLNITKRRGIPLFRESVSSSKANIAYVAGTAVEVANNLSISDRSTSLFPNREFEPEYRTISSDNNFEIHTLNFLVTDVFTDSLSTREGTPLFFKHVISTDRVQRVSDIDLTTASGVSLLSISILDEYQQQTEVFETSIDYAKGIVYSNLENSFVSSTDYIVYFIRYTVRIDGVIYTYTDLLSSEPIYGIASYEDLDEDLEIIQDGRKVYLINELENTYEIYLPGIGDYAYKTRNSARLRILSPAGSDTADPWYIKVSNGSFFATLSDGNLYKYHIAEFLTQSWSPLYPYKQSTETPNVLSSSLLKLDHDLVHEDEVEDLWLTILIDDEDGDALAAYTTDLSLEGEIASNGATYEIWSETSQVGIRSVDYRQGFVLIDGLTLSEDYEITASYNYEETAYEFTLANFNPIQNRSIQTTPVVFFIYPDTILTTRTQTLYYLKLNEYGKVTESNWTSFDNTTQTIGGKTLYFEAKPTWLDDSSYEVFIDEYSTEGDGIFLVLGTVSIGEAQGIDSLTIIDSRRRGGGINVNFLGEAQDIQEDVGWFWDLSNYDGTPYPGNASYLIEVPVTVLEEAGGTFTMGQVRSVVERHTALGVYPVVRAYGIEIDITNLSFSTGAITLYWTGYGNIDDIVYQVYTSTQNTGAWSLANLTPIVHIDNGNSCQITGLTPNVIYYISVIGGKMDGDTFQPLVTQAIGPLEIGARGVEAETVRRIKAKIFLPSISMQDSGITNVFAVV